jgi:hypothetical protein
MVGEAVLREVVGAHLLAPVAAAHGAARFGANLSYRFSGSYS